jgi:Flp pilus assembly protein TadG
MRHVTHALERSTRCIRRLQCDSRGIAAVEFAMIVPILLLMFVCISDFGIGIYTNMQVENAAQYGAEYAVVNGYDTSAITNAVRGSTSLNNISVSPTQFCGCPSGSSITSTSCTATCSDGSTAGTFVQVSVAHDYSTLISYPGLPASFHLASQSTARLQ